MTSHAIFSHNRKSHLRIVGDGCIRVMYIRTPSTGHACALVLCACVCECACMCIRVRPCMGVCASMCVCERGVGKVAQLQ